MQSRMSQCYSEGSKERMLGTYGKEVERFCGEMAFEIDLDT